jgi:hypothetical protein
MICDLRSIINLSVSNRNLSHIHPAIPAIPFYCYNMVDYLLHKCYISISFINHIAFSNIYINYQHTKGGSFMTIRRPFCRICAAFLSLITIAMLCAVPVQSAKAEGNAPIGIAVCTSGKSLKLRSGPSASCPVVIKLPARTFVKVYAQSGKWFRSSTAA